LKKAGWDAQEVDLWEINEAFAMVTMCPIDDFKLDAEKVNINGGACALVTLLVLLVHVSFLH
jgi:acetyl-CoA C-acetyltransferase